MDMEIRKIRGRKKIAVFLFLARLQVQLFILLYLERKKRARLPLLVIHQKRAVQKKLKCVFLTSFQLRQMPVERLWHDG
jgi:hypothetical protein